MLYERICKMLMVLESNIQAIRPCTETLTYLLIELRPNGPVNNISHLDGCFEYPKEIQIIFFLQNSQTCLA